MNDERALYHIPASLKHWKYEIERIGKKYGLDFHPNFILLVDHEQISEMASYSGYPVRYHHWRFGQESIRIKRSYRWGLHIIYEMVIPTVPCYSYFLDSNPEETQKAVIAHACVGHNDFFKNNAWFSDTPTDLHHRFGDNANRIEEIRREVGREVADRFLEACLSLDDLFDPLVPLVTAEPLQKEKEKKEKRYPKRIQSRDKLPDYMEDYLNPEEYLTQETIRIKEEEDRETDIKRRVIIPPRPVRDILGFILKEAPLEGWQQEVVRIVREESYATRKGGQTKIMNEGWAAFWEATIMAAEGVALDHELCSFARTFAGVLSSSGFNPYRLGKQLWDDIKFRWDTGRHGPLYENCEDNSIKESWEEFVVFKALFDQHGGMTTETEYAWKAFSTLLRETQEERGFLPNAFFTKDVWILEWFRYQEAEEKIPELERALLEARVLEAQFPSCEGSNGRRPKDWYQSMAKSTSSYRFWSSEELEREINHYRFYQTMGKRMENREIKIVRNDIPDSWVVWASKHEFRGQLGVGYQKLLEVRKTYNDVTFIQEFFTEDFCKKYKYFVWGVTNPIKWDWDGEKRAVINSRDYQRVRSMILSYVLNMGVPKIVLFDANFRSNSELRFIHLHDGRDLCYHGCPDCGGVVHSLTKVLERLYLVWGKRKKVHIETMVTEWPSRIPPWYHWFGREQSSSETTAPKRTWVRYSYGEKGHDKKEFAFSTIERADEIEKILPQVPDE